MTYQLYQPAEDLFGDVPVLEYDLVLWVAYMAPHYLSDRSFDNYVRSYNVADKIKTAKRAGRWEEVAAGRRAIWHDRFGRIQ